MTTVLNSVARAGASVPVPPAVDVMLRRLGLDHPGQPDVEALIRIPRAQDEWKRGRE